MDIDDVLDLLELIATTIEPMIGMTGNQDCDSCHELAISRACIILRTINSKYMIASVKD